MKISGDAADSWLKPDWPAPTTVRAVMTTRDLGGAGQSGSPWAALNLGTHVGDDPQAVCANRMILQRALLARPVFLDQVHGNDVVWLDAHSPNGLRGDASLTATPLLACAILVADCLPILLCDRQGRRVAALHAGWRGLADGVIERTLAALLGSFEGPPATGGVMAWLGPCIGPQAFEVGAEVRAAFVDHDGLAAIAFEPLGAGKYLANLPMLARLRLQAGGVAEISGNDGGLSWCTVSHPDRFYSYRRDQRAKGATGRMAACIWKI